MTSKLNGHVNGKTADPLLAKLGAQAFDTHADVRLRAPQGLEAFRFVAGDRAIAVAAPTWYLARQLASRELHADPGGLTWRELPAGAHVAIVARWEGSAAGSSATLKLVEERR